MIFKKNRYLIDKELGPLVAKTSMLRSSIIRWQKTVEFLGNDIIIEISGTLNKLHPEQRTIIINAIKNRGLIEKQVLEVINGFCVKYALKFDAWRDHFNCSHIFSDNRSLYISINDKLNNLTYEVELK